MRSTTIRAAGCPLCFVQASQGMLCSRYVWLLAYTAFLVDAAHQMLWSSAASRNTSDEGSSRREHVSSLCLAGRLDGTFGHALVETHERC